MPKKCTKLILKTQGRARTVAKGMSIKSGEPFDTYYCKICEGWHVGHSAKKRTAILKKQIMENNSAVLGIDPGKTGAMALICGKHLEIHDFKNTLASQKVLSVLKGKFSIKFCILEKVWLRADERDVKKAETLIRNAQMWEDLLTLNGIDYEKYAPDTWRKGLVPAAGSKERMTQKAIQLFPLYEKEFYRHDRAEAALMAYRAQRHIEAGRPTRLVA
jgi:hypothetical protein